jgi:hypothetical protein
MREAPGPIRGSVEDASAGNRQEIRRKGAGGLGDGSLDEEGVRMHRE